MSETNNKAITCQICGETCHVIAVHIGKSHKDDGWTLEKYREKFGPMAPLMSKTAERELAERRGSKSAVTVQTDPGAPSRAHFLHDVFGFGKSPAAMNARGEPIAITVLDRDPETEQLIPDKDSGYIFDINLCKTVLQALEMNTPGYFWGHMGVGKSSIIEQIAAHTNRPYTRVQHTANMEEADVEGRWIINANKEMEFQLGPLAVAMRDGHLYCADEYDFASPMILSCYQAVLEGKPLFIKAANLKISPHKNFRFCATGNTNGAGDESGLYQGTMLQNAANYERFGIVENVRYMPRQQEVGILVAKTRIEKSDAEKVIEFATLTRESFDRKDVAFPMSPRSALNAAKHGVARNDLKFGINVSYINRLPAVSAEVARQLAQRIFG